MSAADKHEIYREADAQIAALVGDLRDPIAAMASFASALHGALDYASWTGFYRVVQPRLLRIGPYQGPVGCIDIPFDQGVCGTAAAREETLVVRDVHAFEGHIACDPEARSEIVVPVFDPGRRLVAVLDVDSKSPEAFDDVDRLHLESLVGYLGPSFERD